MWTSLRSSPRSYNCNFWSSFYFSTLVPQDGLTLKDFIPSSKSDPQNIIERRTASGRLRLPDWLKRDTISNVKNPNYIRMKQQLRGMKLSTVCEEARCPNIGECWGGSDGNPSTATISNFVYVLF